MSAFVERSSQKLIQKSEVKINESGMGGVQTGEGADDEDDMAALLNAEVSPNVRQSQRFSQRHQSSMKSISEDNDEYTKMIVRQQMDERLKDFED